MQRGVVSESRLDLPNLDAALFQQPDAERLFAPTRVPRAPRFLLLYGSLRERSFSRLAAEEAARILRALGGETRMFNPSGLPLVDDASEDHPKVKELRELAQWAEGMVWSSPERHGAMTGLMKTQIDWIPLSSGAVRPTQGKTLAVMQVSVGKRASTRQVGMAAISLLPLSLLLLFGSGQWLPMYVVFAALYGIGNGVMTIVRGALPAELYGRAAYGAISGAMATPVQIAVAAGPFVASLLYAAGNGYPGTLLALAGISAAGAILFRYAITHLRQQAVLLSNQGTST